MRGCMSIDTKNIHYIILCRDSGNGGSSITLPRLSSCYPPNIIKYISQLINTNLTINGLCQAIHANTTRHGVLENTTRRTERTRNMTVELLERYAIE